MSRERLWCITYTTPVWAGDIVNLVATVRIATTNVSIAPRKSMRMPSHLCQYMSVRSLLLCTMIYTWLVTVNQYALQNTSAHSKIAMENILPIFNVHPWFIFQLEALCFPVGSNGCEARQRLRKMGVERRSQNSIFMGLIWGRCRWIKIRKTIPKRCCLLFQSEKW